MSDGVEIIVRHERRMVVRDSITMPPPGFELRKRVADAIATMLPDPIDGTSLVIEIKRWFEPEDDE